MTTRRLGLQLQYFWAALDRLDKNKFAGSYESKKTVKQAVAELTEKMRLYKEGGYEDMDDEEAVWLIGTVWPLISSSLVSLGLID